MDLDEKIIALRGNFDILSLEGDNFEVMFQNNILRPILKNQNNILLEVLKNYIQKHKIPFKNLEAEKKLQFIELTIQRDIKFRNFLKGMIVGWFTQNEYLEYIKNSSQLNKRMMSLLISRYQSQVQILSD